MEQRSDPEVIKYDSEKVQPHLFPPEVLTKVLQILQYGAQKYSPENWKLMDKRARYYDAALRHLFAWAQGEDVDQESGFSHIDHALTNMVFLSWMNIHSKGEDFR